MLKPLDHFQHLFMQHYHKEKKGFRPLKTLFSITCFVIYLATASISSFAQPDMSLVGYASMGDGTTGGEGGIEYYVSDYEANGYDEPGEYMYQVLRSYRYEDDWDQPIIIYVDMPIREEEFGRSKMDVTDNRNVSIIGVGCQGEFDGVGTTVRRSSNIIFRNLTIHHVSQGEGTGIELTGDSHHIWIDRNTFFSEGPDTFDDKDYYDGLVDIKRNVEYVTVSWNIFRDSWKASLLGHNDNESLAANHITYHHNIYKNINSRTPLIRFATVHTFNNHFVDIHSSAINCRMGAQVRVENNYFDNVGSGTVDTHADYVQGPVGWFYGSNDQGYWEVIDNTVVDSPTDHMESNTTTSTPYDYQNVLHDADEVPAILEQYAGACLDIDTESDASLTALFTDGIPVEGFDPDVFEYEQELAHTTESAPEVTATANQEEAQVNITQASELPGDATVVVTSANGEETSTYTISFTLVDLSDDASLASIEVDGQHLEDFNSDQYTYDYELPYGTEEVPTVTAVPGFEEAEVSVTQASSLPGATTIEVTSADGSNSETYTINFTLSDPSDDATLADLMVDESTINGFASDQTSYTIEYPEGTTDVPVVSAEASDEHADVSITQADGIPGSATVEVTAQDGETTMTYNITFTEISTWHIYDASVMPDVSNPSFVESDWENNPDYQIIEDEEQCEPGNTLLQLVTDPEDRKGNWRYDLPGGQEEITIVTRVKGISPDYDKLLVIDMQFAGTRERIYLNNDDNTYFLRHAGEENPPLPDDATYQDWHIIRLTKSGDDVSFYFDEEPIAVESVTTSEGTGNNYFRFGDPFSDNRSGALIDWVIWDETGAYAPEEGSAIPYGLCTATGPETVTSLDERTDKPSVSVYPNPSTGDFTIETSYEGFTYTLHDMTGNLVQSGENNSSVMTANGLTSGVYLLRITSEDHSETIKLIKQ